MVTLDGHPSMNGAKRHVLLDATGWWFPSNTMVSLFSRGAHGTSGEVTIRND